MTHPIRFVWTVPRSVSTSFERMMMERDDHTVFDEPFSRSYYFSPDRRSGRFEDTIPGSTAREVLDELEDAARARPVFVKDMAYQALPLLGTGLLDRVESSFLVRDPGAALRSMHRSWPDFTDEEAGWSWLDVAADHLESQGRPLVVISSDALCADPEGVVRAWCDAVGLEHDEDAMTWEAGMRPEWKLWEEWHESSASSTGFEPLRPPPPPPGPDEPRLHEAYEDALPVYERLLAHAVHP